jgi:hypothetical protein
MNEIRREMRQKGFTDDEIDACMASQTAEEAACRFVAKQEGLTYEYVRRCYE